MNISQRLKIFRKHLRMSQGEMGDVLGVTQAQVSNAEKGRNYPPISHILILHERYGLNPNWLLLGEGEMTIKRSEGPDLENRLKEIEEKLKKLF